MLVTITVSFICTRPPYFQSQSNSSTANMDKFPNLIFILTLSQISADPHEAILKLDPQQALFIKQNLEIILTNSFGHLTIKFDLEQLVSQLNSLTLLQRQVSSLNVSDNWPRNLNLQQREALDDRLRFGDSFITSTVSNARARLENIVKGFGMLDSIRDPEDSELVPDRQKRQAIAAGLSIIFGGLSGAATGLFTKTTISDILQRKQNVISHQVEENMLDINTAEKDIQKLNSTIMLLGRNLRAFALDQDTIKIKQSIMTATTTASIISNKITDYCDTISRARHGKIDLSSLNANGLQHSIQALADKAAAKGFRISISTPDDLTTQSTSFVVNRSKRVAYLVIHISLFVGNSELLLYRHVPTPIQIETPNKTSTNIFLEIVSPHEYIAVDKQGLKYVPIAASDLATCTPKRDQRFCPQLVTFKNSAETCIFSLYKGDPELTKKTCQTKLTSSHFKLIRISSGTWVVTTSRKLTIHLICDRKEPSKHVLQGIYLIKLPTECHLNSNIFNLNRPRFEAEATFDATGDSVVKIPQFEAAKLLSTNITDIGAALSQVGVPLKEYEVANIISFRRELQNIRERISPLAIRFPNLFSHVSTTFTVLLVCAIAIATYYGYRKYRRRQRGKLIPLIPYNHRNPDPEETIDPELNFHQNYTEPPTPPPTPPALTEDRQALPPPTLVVPTFMPTARRE